MGRFNQIDSLNCCRESIENNACIEYLELSDQCPSHRNPQQDHFRIISMPDNTHGSFAQTKQTTLKRLPQRGSHKRSVIYKILDEGLICYVGFIDAGHPVVIPTAYGRRGDMLYIHGSLASRMLRALAKGRQICVTVTLLDGLVLARSAFHHSMNYRSVVVFGTASIVSNPKIKLEALRSISEHIIPGRWADVRKPNRVELRQTLVLRLPLTEASAKTRSGPPVDEEADYSLPVWAGEVPVSLVVGRSLADPRLLSGIAIPSYVRRARMRSLK